MCPGSHSLLGTGLPSSSRRQDGLAEQALGVRSGVAPLGLTWGCQVSKAGVTSVEWSSSGDVFVRW